MLMFVVVTFSLLSMVLQSSAILSSEFELDPVSNIYCRQVSNKSDHPFPYTASVIVCTCLFGVVAVIICLGADL